MEDVTDGRDLDSTATIDRIANEMFARIAAAKVHPSIIAALGAAMTVLDYAEGGDDVEEEDVPLDCCKCFIRYTLAFTRHMKEGDCDAIISESGDIAADIFGEECASTAATLINQEHMEMEEDYQEEFDRPPARELN